MIANLVSKKLDVTCKILTDASNASNTTVATTMKLAWGFTLQLFCGVDEVVFGEIVSGRHADIPNIDKYGQS
jgi:glycerol kinase